VSTRHDFTVDLDYVKLPEKEHKTAVLRIKLKRKPNVAYLFDLDKAWIVREPRLMFEFCLEVCETLYGIVDQRRMAHIAMAIEDKIDDLIRSKPAPEQEPIIIGEASIKDNTGRRHYFPIERGMIYG